LERGGLKREGLKRDSGILCDVQNVNKKEDYTRPTVMSVLLYYDYQYLSLILE
jgi:hypothetical protein